MNVAGNFGVPVPMAANVSAQVKPMSGLLIAFLCTVAGTLDIYFGKDATGTHVVTSLPLAPGFNPLAISFPEPGCFLALSGGAAGSAIVG